MKRLRKYYRKFAYWLRYSKDKREQHRVEWNAAVDSMFPSNFGSYPKTLFVSKDVKKAIMEWGTGGP